ncbi:uncharacterized protein GVI51_J11627 [Nakaseomyces glabratus]|uniref:HIT-type domain-containing protein n=2 Tax=Candida glabrata TaxID=5478 RepID=F2Z6G5_CANGA|nr:uncharacterized protein CAGL0J11814g [Nakaseomyces glabratus]AAD55397.1 hypothetical protein [Nakaseomyces glabratus]KAH7583832.1 Zinc finger HIT-type profile [Nakaseomyces glabratus]KAH7584322.1 Zinc finger HIT-type profile [Nakaseomyces glabratus]KAH7585565.1 Zinc finger HIT-type profile [Nakaseomyces glabratus]KAH7598066.1 Zinc finger HIT-type profile [Nakaseomyces glabratus]|eukprot:XP_448227.1 uncharacterized protein CAGL0J11814g [[Candida] glabrata]
MPRPFSVQEIDPRTYNPNIYYSALDAEQQRRSQNAMKRKKNSNKITSSRNAKRINYSLADLEARLYTAQNKENSNEDKSSAEKTNKFSETELIQSKRRFMELDTENIKDIGDVPTLLSSVSGIPRDRIDSVTTAITNAGDQTNNSVSAGRGSSNNRFEINSSVFMSYRSTKPPKSKDQAKKKSSTNRQLILRKVLTSKRKLHTYLDTLDHVNRSIILHNVYNKKYFKVLPLITICSICGGYDSLSNCVACGDKICSVSCYRTHNETRCTGR